MTPARPAVSTSLVVGGGIAGAAAAALLARGGVQVDLVEVRTDVYSPDAGIVLRPNALRILRDLGVDGSVLADGFAYGNIGLRGFADGEVVGHVEPPTNDPDYPPFIGYHRSRLAQELLARAVALGVEVHSGTSPVSLRQDDGGVDVLLEDDTDRRYDLVVGADGIRSWTRRQLGIDVETTRNEVAAWRALLPRPDSVTRSELYVTGPRLLIGCAPAGQDTVNAFVLERLEEAPTSGEAKSARTMRELTTDYHGLWDDIRSQILDDTPIYYMRFETHSLPAPWHRGRVVLIGDAVHAAPPTIGQGIALALEDASVLAEVVLASDGLDDQMWESYHARRGARVEETMATTRAWSKALISGDPIDLQRLLGQMSRRLDDEPA